MELQNNTENSSVTLNLADDMVNGHSRRDSNSAERLETQEKRTRFSLAHDEGKTIKCINLLKQGKKRSKNLILLFVSFTVLFEGSIGNTSDNLEAVSEAASNHSVASSLELETEDQNDNLSDMVSANVSGRGTPNISGL